MRCLASPLAGLGVPRQHLGLTPDTGPSSPEEPSRRRSGAHARVYATLTDADSRDGVPQRWVCSGIACRCGCTLCVVSRAPALIAQNVPIRAALTTIVALGSVGALFRPQL